MSALSTRWKNIKIPVFSDQSDTETTGFMQGKVLYAYLHQKSDV